MDAQQAQGLIVLSSPLFSAISGIRQGAEQAALHQLPGITLFPKFAKSGGLMGYGPSLDDLYPRPANMIAKILRGEKPGDMPLERPSRYRFVVNLKAAKALGLELSPSLVARADELNLIGLEFGMFTERKDVNITGKYDGWGRPKVIEHLRHVAEQLAIEDQSEEDAAA